MARVMALLLCGACSVLAAGPLLLSPMLRAGEHVAARKAAAVSVNQVDFGFSGFLTTPSQNSMNLNHIFFWYQPCLEGCNASAAPLLVWLQGGPGGPGTFGAMTEIGNWYVGEKGGEPKERCNSWCKTQNCLFVDQPVEAGYSFQTDANGAAVTDIDRVDFTDSSPQAMSQIHSVVRQFLDLFPELKTAPLVITGESYGGLYTPNLGVLFAADPDINFVSLSVGDPVINGKYQWAQYPDTLYGMGVIMDSERTQLRGVLRDGVTALEAFESGRGTCKAAFDHWNSIWDDDGHDSGGQTAGLFTKMTGSTMTENILMSDSPDSFGFYNAWFARPEVAAAFHVTGDEKRHPTDKTLGLRVYDSFVKSGDFCTNSSDKYASLIKDGIELMIYSSSVDPLLGPPTTEAGIQAILQDYGSSELKSRFATANKTLWTAGQDSTIVGYAKCVKAKSRFCYVIVRNAGHMTPAFAPRASLEMLNRFLKERSFDSDGVGPVGELPACAQCGGAGPFAGESLPACAAP